MADWEERNLAMVECESDEEDTTALQWTARRMEASDDDGDDDGVNEEDNVKETHRRSAIGLSSDSDESNGLSGAPEYYDELEEAGTGGELDKVSQEQGDLRDIVVVNQAREKVESEEVFVPTSGWFYMHDDRIDWGHQGRRRSGVNLLDCTDKQKWRHDKFEEMTLQETLNKSFMHHCLKFCYILYTNCFAFSDTSLPWLTRYTKCDNHTLKVFQDKSNQQQSKDRGKGQSTNYFGNQNITSRTVKGRRPVRYKPPMKSKHLDALSKHQQRAKLSPDTPAPRIQQFSSTSYSSLPLSDSLSSSIYGTVKTQRSNEKQGRINKYTPTSIEKDDKHSALERKTASKEAGSKASHYKDSFQHIDGNHFNYQPMLFPMSADGGENTSLSLSTQQIYQPYGPYPIYNNVNMLSPPLLHPVIEQGPITSRIQTHLPLLNHQTSHPGNGYQSFPKSLSSPSVGILPQTSYFELDLIGRGSDILTRVMQLGDWPYGAVGGFAPTMAPAGYGPLSGLGSRTCEITSVRVDATEPCNSDKPHNAPEPVVNEFWQRQLKPQRQCRYSKMSWDFSQNV